MDGKELLARLKSSHQYLEVIILTGHGSLDSAVECTKLSAWISAKALRTRPAHRTVEGSLRIPAMKKKFEMDEAVDIIRKIAIGDSALGVIGRLSASSTTRKNKRCRRGSRTRPRRRMPVQHASPAKRVYAQLPAGLGRGHHSEQVRITMDVSVRGIAVSLSSHAGGVHADLVAPRARHRPPRQAYRTRGEGFGREERKGRGGLPQMSVPRRTGGAGVRSCHGGDRDRGARRRDRPFAVTTISGARAVFGRPGVPDVSRITAARLFRAASGGRRSPLRPSRTSTTTSRQRGHDSRSSFSGSHRRGGPALRRSVPLRRNGAFHNASLPVRKSFFRRGPEFRARAARRAPPIPSTRRNSPKSHQQALEITQIDRRCPCPCVRFGPR